MSESDFENLSDIIRYEEDQDHYEDLTDLVKKHSFDEEKSNLRFIEDHCANPDDMVTLENFTQEMVNNNDLFVIKTLTADNKFKIGTCMLKSQLIEQLNIADRTEKIPPNIKSIWTINPHIEHNDNDLLNGRCCEATPEFLYKTIVGMHITMQSLIDILSSPNQIWYAVPIFGNRRKRIGNIFSEQLTMSGDHGQITGKIIYKLFTKDEIKKGVELIENNLTPLNKFLYNEIEEHIGIPESRRTSIDSMYDLRHTHVKQIIDYLNMYYLIGKRKSYDKIDKNGKPRPNEYNYIFMDALPSDIPKEYINYLIDHKGYLPHWLHPHKEEYYKYIEDDLPPNLSILELPSPVRQTPRDRYMAPEIQELINAMNQVNVAIRDDFQYIDNESNPSEDNQIEANMRRSIAEWLGLDTPEIICPPDKELIDGKCLKKCRPDQRRHPQTKRCRKIRPSLD